MDDAKKGAGHRYACWLFKSPQMGKPTECLLPFSIVNFKGKKTRKRLKP